MIRIEIVEQRHDFVSTDIVCFLYIMYTVLFYNFFRDWHFVLVLAFTPQFNLFPCHFFIAMLIQNWSIVIFYNMNIFSAYFV